MGKKILTADEARAELTRRGLSISAWARRHGLNLWTVYAVLQNRRAPRFGESHKVAVLLGMKDGTIEAE